MEVLDKYRELNKYSSRDLYHLKNVELDIMKCKDENTGKIVEKIPNVKSIVIFK